MAAKMPKSRRRPPLVEEVCAFLEKQILKNMEKGNPWLMPERKLAEHLKVSRTVVREATQRLESQGLLQVEHGKGIKAVNHLLRAVNRSISLSVPNDARRLQQLTEARLILEPAVAGAATLRRQAEDLKQLNEIQERLKSAKTAEEAVEFDLDFHRVLAHAAGNEILELLLGSLADLGRESRIVTISRFGMKRAHEQHAKILAAVEAGDGELACSCMRIHLQHAMDDLKT